MKAIYWLLHFLQILTLCLTFMVPTRLTNRRWSRKNSNLYLSYGLRVSDFSEKLNDPTSELRISTLYKGMQPSMHHHHNSIATLLWDILQYEASLSYQLDKRTVSLVANSILVQQTFEDAIIDYVVNLLETPVFPATSLRGLFMDTLSKNESIAEAWASDLLAATIYDDFAPNTLGVLLFNKGYHALVAHRIAHTLWCTGRDGVAKLLQSLVSRTFSSDIHPASCIGPACFCSNGGQLVIGETASVGKDCYFSHGVTLGGTGKESGNRHPKLGDSVYLGPGATILGNIAIQEGSVINTGAVVTKAVAAYTRVGGVPAKPIITINTRSLSFTDLVLTRNDHSPVIETSHFLHDLPSLRKVAYTLLPKPV